MHPIQYGYMSGCAKKQMAVRLAGGTGAGLDSFIRCRQREEEKEEVQHNLDQ